MKPTKRQLLARIEAANNWAGQLSDEVARVSKRLEGFESLLATAVIKVEAMAALVAAREPPLTRKRLIPLAYKGRRKRK